MIAPVKKLTSPSMLNNPTTNIINKTKLVAETIDQEYGEIVSILEHGQQKNSEDQHKINTDTYWEKKKKRFGEHIIEKQKESVDKHKETTQSNHNQLHQFMNTKLE